MRANLVEVVDAQSQIITIQNHVIDELFKIVSQQLPTEEINNLSVIAEISEAAQIQRKIEEP